MLVTLTDLKLKKPDLKERLKIFLDALLPKLLLLKPPPTNNKETNFFGTMLLNSVPSSIENMKPPLKEEEKNSS